VAPQLCEGIDAALIKMMRLSKANNAPGGQNAI